MPTKFIALFLAGIALSGCMTANSSIANRPAVSAAPQTAAAASDGLDELSGVSEEPSEQVRSKPKPLRTREIATRPTDASARAQTRSEDWTRAPNEDPEADAKLARQLRICRDC